MPIKTEKLAEEKWKTTFWNRAVEYASWTKIESYLYAG